jgi:quinol monooxygenase YgiN
MTSIKKIVSAFLAALFMTGLLASAPVSAAEKGCVGVDAIETLSEEEHFMLYES